MSVTALRQLISGMPGVSSKIQDDDCRWRNKTKDELIAAIRGSLSGGGEESVGSGATSSSAGAERPQPLAGSQASLMQSFCSSGQRRAAQNNEMHQDMSDELHKKSTDEVKPFEMMTKTQLRSHASRVAGMTQRHASGKRKTNTELIDELRAVANSAQSRPLMAAFRAGSTSTGLSVKHVPAAEGRSRKSTWGLKADRERAKKAGTKEFQFNRKPGDVAGREHVDADQGHEHGCCQSYCTRPVVSQCRWCCRNVCGLHSDTCSNNPDSCWAVWRASQQ